MEEKGVIIQLLKANGVDMETTADFVVSSFEKFSPDIMTRLMILPSAFAAQCVSYMIEASFPCLQAKWGTETIGSKHFVDVRMFKFEFNPKVSSPWCIPKLPPTEHVKQMFYKNLGFTPGKLSEEVLEYISESSNLKTKIDEPFRHVSPDMFRIMKGMVGKEFGLLDLKGVVNRMGSSEIVAVYIVPVENAWLKKRQ